MLTRKNPKNGDELSILGFGCMRFPAKGGAIDEQRSIAMIRDAIHHGVNYFDTAYIYHGGKSESLLGKALSGGLREQVKIATKLPPFMVTSLKSAQKILSTQLSRLQTDYIDYYLLHMLTDKAMFDRLVSLGVLSWLEQEKAAGTIHSLGFSFHGAKADFSAILSAYPWDFCQIQYNYMDENNQATKEGLQSAADLGIPVIVMEPLRGGQLVNALPAAVTEAFRTHAPDRSPAEWALRWVWNHPQVTLLLSGMSDETQLADNIRVAADALPCALSVAEIQVFATVKEELLRKTKIPCTACGYCMPCPFGVNIPGCFSAYNNKYLLQDKHARFKYFQTLGPMSAKPANAGQCRGCGKCESHCPQSIEIRKHLKTVSREMESWFYKPLLAILRKVLRIKG